MRPLQVIQTHVADFLDYARQRPDVRFELTPVGCGLAGYRPDQIAPMFLNAPANVTLPDAFSAALDPRFARKLTSQHPGKICVSAYAEHRYPQT